MKKILTLLAAIILFSDAFAQAPQKMGYQAVIRNASDVLLTSTTIGIRVSVLQGSATGTAVYVETQTPTTNANGLVSLEIGTGTIVSGTFSGIDWAAGPYYIKTETDPLGGTGYTITGTSQLVSVPYALFSASGAPGAIGLTGATGATGTNGIDGTNGINGANGIDGATGPTGIAGSNGTNGSAGATGTDGIDGAIGATGPTGLSGSDGIDAINGLDGATGLTGATGANGTNGAIG